jgi:hypothetical protein
MSTMSLSLVNMSFSLVLVAGIAGLIVVTGVVVLIAQMSNKEER